MRTQDNSARAGHCVPRPPCGNSGKQSTENDRNITSYFSDKCVVCAHHENTQAAKQHHIEAQTAMSGGLNQRHSLKGQKVAGQQAASHKPPNSMETIPHVVLTRALFSQGVGGYANALAGTAHGPGEHFAR